MGNDLLLILSQSLCAGGGLRADVVKYWSCFAALALTNGSEAASDGPTTLTRN